MMPLASNPETSRFVRFLVVGILNTVVGYGLFAIFQLVTGNSVFAAVTSTVLGAMFNYRSIGTLVFADNGGSLNRFLGVYAAQCCINIGLLWLAAHAGIGPLLAEIFILPLLAVGSFVAMRSLVFTQDNGV